MFSLKLFFAIGTMFCQFLPNNFKLLIVIKAIREKQPGSISYLLDCFLNLALSFLLPYLRNHLKNVLEYTSEMFKAEPSS